MAADVEDGIEVLGLSGKVGELLCRLPDLLVVLEEVDGDVVFGGFNRGGVERRFAAFGRGDGDVGFAVEDVVGVRELGEVPAGWLASVAELVVGGEDEEDGWLRHGEGLGNVVYVGTSFCIFCVV